MKGFLSIPDVCNDVFNSVYYSLIYKRIDAKLNDEIIWFFGREYVKDETGII